MLFASALSAASMFFSGLDFNLLFLRDFAIIRAVFILSLNYLRLNLSYCSVSGADHLKDWLLLFFSYLSDLLLKNFLGFFSSFLLKLLLLLLFFLLLLSSLQQSFLSFFCFFIRISSCCGCSWLRLRYNRLVEILLEFYYKFKVTVKLL